MSNQTTNKLEETASFYTASSQDAPTIPVKDLTEKPHAYHIRGEDTIVGKIDFVLPQKDPSRVYVNIKLDPQYGKCFGGTISGTPEKPHITINDLVKIEEVKQP